MTTSSGTKCALRILVVNATGGLGKFLAHEALSRGHSVSVLARSQDLLRMKFGGDDLARFKHVHIGKGTETQIIHEATKEVDVILNGVGGLPEVAAALVTGGLANGVKKLVHVAGVTNVISDDGITPMWQKLAKKWNMAETTFLAHSACIDAIKRSGMNYVIFCPAFMKSVGKASSPPVEVRINRPSGGFVSFEDAAVVMVKAAERDKWDGQCITAATLR